LFFWRSLCTSGVVYGERGAADHGGGIGHDLAADVGARRLAVDQSLLADHAIGPRAADQSDGQEAEHADEQRGADPERLLLEAAGMRDAGLDVAALGARQPARMVGEPMAGAIERQAVQQGLRLGGRCRLLVVAQRAFKLRLADQELALLVEPRPQPRPLAQQRLVRDLDRLLAAVLPDHQQARLHQPVEQPVRPRRQVVP
jgi:hypothetical protein